MSQTDFGVSIETLRDLSRTKRAKAFRYLSVRVRDRLGVTDPFAVEDPTPPPIRPTSLPGSLWAVTTVFNPTNQPIWKENYQLFRMGLVERGVPLLAVELAFEGRPFELGEGDAEILVQLRDGDLLWQRERLLNLGMRSLPQDCDKVVWVDCDILFSNPSWAEETSRLLEDYVVVQPFLHRVRMGQGKRPEQVSNPEPGMGDDQVYYGFGYGMAAKGPRAIKSYYRGGSSGLAWAFRRSVLDCHGLYDRHILGGADLVMARAMFLGENCVPEETVHSDLRSHIQAWAGPFFADVVGSVAYTNGGAFHLWHGSLADRGYVEREEILRVHRYRPSADVQCGSGGPLRWAPGASQALRGDVARRLAGRVPVGKREG